MEIIIESRSFPYDIGCRLLKAKYAVCPFEQLVDTWDSIEPITFKEITKNIANIEERRIAINCLGIDKLVKEIKPKLIKSETIEKTTSWVNEDGSPHDHNFKDTYELYEVSAKDLGLANEWDWDERFFHYVKCKDTSTNREYLIWVNAASVYETNTNDPYISRSKNYGQYINPIQAIAWTIQTNVELNGIEQIVRQGDCILIKEKEDATYGSTRHLTENEYRELLVAES